MARTNEGLLIAALTALTAACGTDPVPLPAPGCVTGQTIACACAGGVSGVQACLPDRTYGVCACPVADSGTTDAPAADAPLVDAGSDVAPSMDAPVVDAPVGDAPTSEQPPTDAPVEDVSTVDALDAPTVDLPTMDAPTVDVFAGDVPAIDAPVPVDAPDVVDVPVAVDVPATLVAARPVAPLTGAHARSRRPTFRWQLAGAVDGARVTLCRNRAMSTGCQSFDARGAEGSPAADLAAGPWFWTARATSSGVVVGAAGPVWRLRVATSPATGPVRPWGFDPDVDGDGLGDVLAAVVDDAAHVYLGTAGSLAGTRRSLPAPTESFGFGTALDAAGDVDGDGYGDLVVSAPGSDALLLYRGGAGFPATATPVRVAGPTNSRIGASVAGAGDVNGDGYHDIAAVGGDGNLYVVTGGAGTLAATRAALSGVTATTTVLGAGDVTGDGFDDLLVIAGGTASARLVPGSAAGLNVAGAVTLAGALAGPAGDLDNDGFADLAVVNPTTGRFSCALGGATLGDIVLAVPTRLSSPYQVPPRPLDANGDGFDDLLLRDRISVLVAPGSATRAFVLAPYYPVYGVAPLDGPVGAGDVDGDGRDDLLTATGGVLSITPGGAGGLELGRQTCFDFSDPGDRSNTLGFAAVVGDVNGDRRPDLGVLRQVPRAGGGSASAIEIHLGTAPGFDPAGWAALFGPPPIMGVLPVPIVAAVALGDVNGDGFDDVGNLAQFGSVFSTTPLTVSTYHGGSAGMTTGRVVELPTDNSLFHRSPIVSGGDVDGDRYSDLIVGYHGPRVYRGSTGGLAASAAMAPAPSGYSPRYAQEGGNVGDLNGDGFVDIAADSVIYPGSSTGPGASTQRLVGHWGRALGDVNRDGYVDLAVIVSAGREFAVEVHPGSAAGASATATATFAGGDVQALGDVNRDGYADFVVTDDVRRTLYLGGAAGVASTWMTMPQPDSSRLAVALGNPLTGYGDVTGDGVSDAVFNTPVGVIVQSLDPTRPRPVTVQAPRGSFATNYR